MISSRRSFLSALAAGTLVPLSQAFGQETSKPSQSPAANGGARGTSPIALSTYSLWRFRNDALRDMDKCLDIADEMGFDGVEVLLYQIEQNDLISHSKLMSYKRRAQRLGLPLIGMSTHQGFVTPDREARKFNIDRTIGQIELAYKLGIPTMRVNTGRWGTSASFDALMANRGIEPPLEGYTDEDAFPWVIEAFEKCMPVAEKCGVVLGLENHWGFGAHRGRCPTDRECGRLPMAPNHDDTGNFLERPL